MMLFSISYYRHIYRDDPGGVSGHVLDAPEVFYALALLSLPEFYLLRMFVRAWQRLQEFKASRARLDEFFSHPEPAAPPAERWRRRRLLLGGGGGGDGSSKSGGGTTGGAVGLEGGRFRWPRGAAAAGSSKDGAPGGGSSDAAVSALGVEAGVGVGVESSSDGDDVGVGVGGRFDSSTASSSVVLSFSSAQTPAASGAALTDVRLELRPGELLGVCGSTGAGKTSLLACILGELAELQDDGAGGRQGGGGGGAGAQGAAAAAGAGAEDGAAAGAGAGAPAAAGGVLVAGRTSFLAQQPWVAWGSVRDNMLDYPEEEPDHSHSRLGGHSSSHLASGHLYPSLPGLLLFLFQAT
jgi:hypothetical protein